MKEFLIGISANRARAGKDTVANILADLFSQKVICRKFAFADRMKSNCMRDFGFSYDQMYGELKDIQDNRYLHTPREILQTYGSFFVFYNENYWINRIFEDKQVADINIVTDCRRKKEVDFIKEQGGIHLRIFRDEIPGELVSGKDHLIENELGEYRVDHFINNKGTIEDLKSKVYASVKQMGFLINFFQ
jgi:hypothetical protein